MKTLYFTIAGTKHYYGSDFLKTGMQVKLTKEKDNEYDAEAIRVELRGLGKIGYVANSPYTTLGESLSAGRLYDKIKKVSWATVLYVLPNGVVCRVNTKSIKG